MANVDEGVVDDMAGAGAVIELIDDAREEGWEGWSVERTGARMRKPESGKEGRGSFPVAVEMV